MSDGDFLWKLIAVVSNITCLITMLWSLRRKPPLAEELYKNYATKGEFEKLDKHNSEIHAELFELIRKMQAAHQEDLKIIERAIGRLEGIIQNIKK